jgi:hypothetical protein
MKTNWEAVSAISTAVATIVALAASWLALKSPQWDRERDRLSTAREILRASREAILVFYGLQRLFSLGSRDESVIRTIRIRCDHIFFTLDRLLSRPNLSDGIIAVGAGAMSILQAIKMIPTKSELVSSARANLAERDKKFAALFTPFEPSNDEIESIGEIVKVVISRAKLVEAHYKIDGLNYENQLPPADN